MISAISTKQVSSFHSRTRRTDSTLIIRRSLVNVEREQFSRRSILTRLLKHGGRNFEQHWNEPEQSKTTKRFLQLRFHDEETSADRDSRQTRTSRATGRVWLPLDCRSGPKPGPCISWCTLHDFIPRFLFERFFRVQFLLSQKFYSRRVIISFYKIAYLYSISH